MNSLLRVIALVVVASAWRCGVAAEPDPVAAPPTAPAEASPTVQPSEQPPTEIDLAFHAAGAALVTGPSKVAVADQATLALPEGYGFVPQAEAKRLLEAMGNSVGPTMQGMVVSTTADGLPWFTIVSFEPEGYIPDEDAKEWDADELLEGIKSGTEEDNERRREQGYGELEIIGWAEAPRYDAASHRLVWSIATREHYGQGNASSGVNYRTLQLGRHGYVAMNMVTSLDALPQYRGDAETLLAALEFDQGKRYAEFDASTDKVAEYGLAALVAGAAAKKLGFFALAAAFLLKAWKLVLVAAIAVGAGVQKLLGRKGGVDAPA